MLYTADFEHQPYVRIRGYTLKYAASYVFQETIMRHYTHPVFQLCVIIRIQYSNYASLYASSIPTIRHYACFESSSMFELLTILIMKKMTPKHTAVCGNVEP